LIIDKHKDIACGASGSAGAFLSPLLGKENDFKNLVTNALLYSTELYKKNFKSFCKFCGTLRIPKDKDDEKKFQDYIPYIDFPFTKLDDGYFFDIGSVVDSVKICESMTQNIDKEFNFNVKEIKYDGEYWIINNQFETKNLIITTGSELNLIDEFYVKIRKVWGRRIDVSTTTKTNFNYHKTCSISKSTLLDNGNGIVSIGATHHRGILSRGISNNDTKELLNKANDIIKLEDIEVVKELVGARASSIDYLPIIGLMINSDKTLKKFPYLKYGTNVSSHRFIYHKNLFVLNGVGGRGFVLAPYLAKILVDYIINNKQFDESLETTRLFKRWAKKEKNETTNC